MTNVLVFAIAAAVGASAAAEPSLAPSTAPRANGGGDTGQIVCRNVEEIGSRLSRRRICRTRAEWEDLQLQERQVIDRVQSFKPCQPNC